MVRVAPPVAVPIEFHFITAQPIPSSLADSENRISKRQWGACEPVLEQLGSYPYSIGNSLRRVGRFCMISVIINGSNVGLSLITCRKKLVLYS